MTTAEVIAIDGPSASGKGTIAQRIAGQLDFHYLDSGALYRLLALQAQMTETPLTDVARMNVLAAGLRPRFEGGQIHLDGIDVTHSIRSEDIGKAASLVATYPQVRSALLDLQVGFARAPGLVADGRDMGSVVFPDARLKVFLTAGAEARAERRYKQLIENGFSANIDVLLRDLRERDQRDLARSAAPLRAAEDAFQLDSSDLSVDEVVAQILRWYREA